MGAFVRLSDAIVRGAMFTIARDACACYLKALRAAGTDGRPGLFLVEASIPDGSTRRVVFEPPLPELVRVARAVPETMCASIASIAGPVRVRAEPERVGRARAKTRPRGG